MSTTIEEKLDNINEQLDNTNEQLLQIHARLLGHDNALKSLEIDLNDKIESHVLDSVDVHRARLDNHSHRLDAIEKALKNLGQPEEVHSRVVGQLAHHVISDSEFKEYQALKERALKEGLGIEP